MTRVVRTVLIPAIIAAAVIPVRADSTPRIQGVVSGVELCPQAWCGAAIFAGIFSGQVGFNRHALGTVAVAVHHEPLPAEPGECAEITDGAWGMWVGLRRIVGSPAGALCDNGDNTFSVSVHLTIDQGGSGDLQFDGILDHNVFPPTIQGTMSQ
jgi:hypothetical protein